MADHVEVEAVLDWSTAPSVGDTVTVGSRPELLHAFATDTGNRVELAPGDIAAVWSRSFPPVKAS